MVTNTTINLFRLPQFKSRTDALLYEQQQNRRAMELESSCYLLNKMMNARDILDTEGDSEALRTLLGVTLSSYEMSTSDLRRKIVNTIDYLTSTK